MYLFIGIVSQMGDLDHGAFPLLVSIDHYDTLYQTVVRASLLSGANLHRDLHMPIETSILIERVLYSAFRS